MSALIATSWEVEVERAEEEYRANLDEVAFRSALTALGKASHEIDCQLAAVWRPLGTIANQRPADGLLQPSRIRQQGAR